MLKWVKIHRWGYFSLRCLSLSDSYMFAVVTVSFCYFTSNLNAVMFLLLLLVSRYLGIFNSTVYHSNDWSGLVSRFIVSK
jgi:hypothetical protein